MRSCGMSRVLALAFCDRSPAMGPAGSNGRRRVLYRVRDVEEWLETHTFRHRADELARALDVSNCRHGEMVNSTAFAGRHSTEQRPTL
jgi:hypothetical protein